MRAIDDRLAVDQHPVAVENDQVERLTPKIPLPLL
jgi:hypothetical protein